MKRILAVLALGLPGLLGAQSEEDIFSDGAFDSQVKKSQEEAPTTQVSYLAGAQLLADSSLVLPSTTSGYGTSGAFFGKGFIKVSGSELGTVYLSYNFTYGLFAGTDLSPVASVYKYQGLTTGTPNYSLGEFYLAFDVSKIIFLRLGSQLQGWSTTSYWSPADLVNTQASSSGALVDTRSGKPGLRVHVPLPNDGNGIFFLDLSRSVSGGNAQDLTQKAGYAFRLDQTFSGFQGALQGYFGPSSDPMLAATLTGNLLGIDLWTEGAWRLPLGNTTFTWSLSAGGQKTWGTDQEWSVKGEYFFQDQGRDDTDLSSPAVQAIFKPLYWGRHYGYLELGKKKFLANEVSAKVSSVVNFSDLSGYVGADLTLDTPGLFPITLYTKYNCGPANREFTLLTGARYLTLGLRAFLEF